MLQKRNFDWLEAEGVGGSDIHQLMVFSVSNTGICQQTA